MQSLIDSIRTYALDLGFTSMGIAPAGVLEQDELALGRWLNQGYQSGMAYMARNPTKRSRPGDVLPGAKSAIVLTMNYFPKEGPEAESSSGKGRISRYAWGQDYHAVIETRLKRLEEFIKIQGGPECKCRSYVDHGPVLEKALAREAGLGFIGKNTLLITEAFGSWVFLSVILTTLRLALAEPQTSQCGSCSLCLDSCPTGAIVAPFVLDAGRCISYLTIENKGDIPEMLQAEVGDKLFGCDICQEVCPYNSAPSTTNLREFFSDAGVGAWLHPEEVLKIETDEEFKDRFRNTPLLRPKRSGLQRNSQVVARNLEASEERP